MTSLKSTDHYSYTFYAKENKVEEYDHDRYGLSFGKYLFNLEVDLFLDLLSSDGKVLDVGTGTGKLFVTLLNKNREVVGVDASPSMISFIKEKYQDKKLDDILFVADAQKLPFPDRSFESLVSSRVLMHVYDWRKAIKEFCRISSKEVILDYPPVSGFTFFIPLFNVFKKMFIADSHPYRIFSLTSIIHEFELNNYKVTSVKRLFVFPVGVHRKLNSLKASTKLEAFFENLGVKKIFGGPVLIKAERIRN